VPPMNSIFSISSDDAYLALSSAACWKCRNNARALCLYCVRGEIDGNRREHFVISNLTEMDESLLEVIRSFPHFREAYSREADMRYFANHCEHCGIVQGDFYLHSKPGGAFFPETNDDFARIDFARIESRIRCNGGEGYGTMEDAFRNWKQYRPD
jgi:hypothetical protein